MLDSFSEVTHRSLGDNLLASVKAIVIGVALVLLAFPILWWNEGRTDISTVAKKAVAVRPDGSQTSGEGKLVAVTGPLEASGLLADPDYLRPTPYVSLRREAEMFAWVEKVTVEKQKKIGGGSKETKIYAYEKKWTSRPQDSDDFRHPEGHENPTPRVHGDAFAAERALIGVYAFPPDHIQLPPALPMALDDARLLPRRGTRAGNYLFLGEGTIAAPRLGDTRLSWSGVQAGRKVTGYGKQTGRELVPYLHKGKDQLYRVVDGTHAEAIAALRDEHTAMTWFLRLVGFLFLWIGLALVIGPVHAVLDILPIVGTGSRLLAGLFLFPVALALGIVTILVAIIAHNLVVLGLVLAVTVGALSYYATIRAGRRRRG